MIDRRASSTTSKSRTCAYAFFVQQLARIRRTETHSCTTGTRLIGAAPLIRSFQAFPPSRSAAAASAMGTRQTANCRNRARSRGNPFASASTIQWAPIARRVDPVSTWINGRRQTIDTTKWTSARNQRTSVRVRAMSGPVWSIRVSAMATRIGAGRLARRAGVLVVATIQTERPAPNAFPVSTPTQSCQRKVSLLLSALNLSTDSRRELVPPVQMQWAWQWE